ncbi:OmpA family protein [Qipengyuania sp. JC766]|uniref:OmpA family protein n=1 Tax=Qipengyuania sp. JC766 TaxID=3232139 RepID=UPI0034577F44
MKLAAGAGSSTGDGQPSRSSVTSVENIRSELGATETARGTVVSLPGDVLFDFDKAEIRESARPVLAKLAQLIDAEEPPTIAVEGHTDSKGDDGYNDRLSRARAQAVRDFLKDVHQVPGDRMEVTGYGEDRPTAPNANPDGTDNEDGRQKNRRVEVILQD